MNKKLAVSVLLCVLSIFFTASFCAAGPLTGKIIVLDPGHGGTDNGAMANGVREANINLSVALKVRDKLTAAGATVFMTRVTDVSLLPPSSSAADELQARVQVAQAADADIFVSLHANSYPNPETNGAMSFYQSGRPDDLARAIQDALVKETGTLDKGVRPANFHVLRENIIPSALIEMGFLTNAAEAARLVNDNYQNRLANGICQGIINYFQARPNNY